MRKPEDGTKRGRDASQVVDAFGDVAKRAKNPMAGRAPTERKGREGERRNSEEETGRGRVNRLA